MSLRVLVVDDSAALREQIRDILERAGYRVTGLAADGEQALEMLAGLEVDLVTMDLDMPNMDAIGTLRILRASGSGIPVLLASGSASDERLLQAIEAGASSFVPKPIDEAMFLEAVARLAARLERGEDRR